MGRADRVAAAARRSPSSPRAVVYFAKVQTVYERIFVELNKAGARYVVVGGVAVVLHGYARFTADLDLVIDLTSTEARNVIATLVRMGFGPGVPVDPLSFAESTVRERWIAEKNMRVFSMLDSRNPMHVIDLFVSPPIPFEELWSAASEVDLPGARVKIASIDHLIEMKKIAGRPQDMIDIEKLAEIAGRRAKP